MKNCMIGALAIGCCAGVTSTASATFHLMQIEQVIGGVNGDVTEQAIQLRMRAAGQNAVAGARIRVWDAAGLNPVMVIDMTTNVPNGVLGSRVLITSTNFNDDTTPTAVPNFTMTNLIPASYLAAGSLTFESNAGLVYWRLSWGGAGYTGPCNVAVDNDANQNACPPFGGALPSSGLQALKFQFAANAPSTNNAADYALTPGAATFTNNANQNFTLQGVPVGACCLQNGDCAGSVTQSDCDKFAGVFQGVGSDCGSVNCSPTAIGACCLTGEICQEAMTPGDCAAANGAYMGDDTTCTPGLCAKPPCLGDANDDHVVNISDLLFVISNWGAAGGNGPADFDQNGTVDIVDLLTVISNWGPCD
ncbi:MAG: hypothetical protein L0219_08780 [Phycisphaerales bacterium]|nr:hypothetical protein [Phycisphaerales bacterium]MCI0675161.1 hypothetical protein [Phycisphaerales bacterium]